MISYMVGQRDVECAEIFMADLKGRLDNRVQLTTDGHKVYLTAIEKTFGEAVDYAMLVKLYGDAAEDNRRYSASVCTGAVKTPINGNPDIGKVSTSYVERQNLICGGLHGSRTPSLRSWKPTFTP